MVLEGRAAIRKACSARVITAKAWTQRASALGTQKVVCRLWLRVTAIEARGPRRRRVICSTLAPAEGPPMGEKVGTTEGAAEPGKRSPVGGQSEGNRAALEARREGAG